MTNTWDPTDAVNSSILVVDDDEYIARGLSLLLRQHGFRVLEAHDGATAIEIAHAEKPDLILLDVEMPQMDGFSVCERLKADEDVNDIPIVFLTAKRADDASIVRGLALGAHDYLHKPFSEHELLARVRAALRIRQAEEESVRAAHLRTIAQLAVTTNDRINSPLAAISGYAQLMAARLNDLEPCQVEVFLRRIDQSVDRIKEFIDRLRHIAEPVVSEYRVGGLTMIDMERSSVRDPEDECRQDPGD